MAETILISLFFRVASIFLGFGMVYVVASIYMKTKGGSKGWIYLAVTFSTLGLWAFMDAFFTVLMPYNSGDIVMGTVMFFIISLNPVSNMFIIRDMKIRVPGWATLRNLLIFMVVFYLVMILYNFVLTPFTSAAAEALSITLAGVGVMFFVATLCDLAIYKGTGLKSWKILAVAALLASVGVFLTVAFTDCCGLQSPLGGTEACSEWTYDYADMLPTPCVAGLLPMLPYSTLIIILGEIIALYGFLIILRSMK